jgi:hypothetical protein
MQSTLYLRIVILSMEPGAWCDWCGVPSASTVSYALEPATGGAPAALRACGTAQRWPPALRPLPSSSGC